MSKLMQLFEWCHSLNQERKEEDQACEGTNKMTIIIFITAI